MVVRAEELGLSMYCRVGGGDSEGPRQTARTLGKRPGERTLEGISPFQVDSRLSHVLETGCQAMGKHSFSLYSILVSPSTCSYGTSCGWCFFIFPLKSLDKGQGLRKETEKKSSKQNITRDIEVENNLTIARGEWGGGSGERGLQELL